MQPFCIPLPKAYKMKFQNCRDNPCPAQSRLEPLNHYLTQILGPLSQFAHHYLKKKKKKKTNSAESLLKRLLFLGYLLWLLLLVLSLGPQGLQRARLLCPWNFPGKDTRVICHSLLQGIFSTQRSNPRVLHQHVDSFPLSHQGSWWDMFSQGYPPWDMFLSKFYLF